MPEVACTACGSANGDQQRFCGQCGTALEQPCAGCGASNPARFAFCGSCGSALHAAPARVAPDVEERRWATVVFADLSGFTALSERTDPEDVRAIVERCMAAMGEIVEKFGGFVSRVVGDEILALFGAPVAHEDDPERAVRAALEMQRCAVDKAEEFGKLPLRIGVNSGEMMFAPVGPPGAREHTVMGDAVNTAKRIQDAAPRGGILVGERTHAATRDAIRYEPITPIEAKGKEAPVGVWRPIEPMTDAGSRAVSEVPMVGRSSELEVLNTIWTIACAESRPHLVTIMGAPGIGKTRIEREFTSQLEDGTLVLRGRSLPYGERTGYGAFAEQIKAAAGIYETDSVPVARNKLEQFVSGLHVQDADVAAHVGSLAGLGSDVTASDREPLFLSARRLIEALGSRVPLVLVFEDVHWADASLLDLVETIAARVRETPVMLLALARPELVDRRPAWGGGSVNAATINLDVLPVAETRALAAQLLPAVADRDILDRLADLAGGNALFCEELAASYTERTAGLVEQLPTSIQGIIAARLDALPPTERRVLLDAAVIGKVFWRGVLESVAPGEPVWEALDSLRTRDLVRRQPSSRLQGDEEFAFKHMLIREVAYATLPRAARRHRHGQVAAFLEASVGDRAAGYASLLAHHFKEAGETDRAVHHLLVAADHAAGSFASAEAISLYEQSLELMEPADARRDPTLLGRALARVSAGDMPTAAAELDELIPRLSDRDRVTALTHRGRVAFWLSDGAGMDRYGTQLQQLAERLGDETPRALGLAMHSYSASITGRLEESNRLGASALRAWPPQAPKSELVFLLGILGLTQYWLGDVEESIEIHERARRANNEAPSVEGILFGGANHALSLAAASQYEEALALLESLADKGLELELAPRWTPRAMNIWAGTLRDIGDLASARELSQRASDAAEGVFPTGAVQGHVDLLFTDLRESNVGLAERAWPGLMERAGALKGFHEWLVQDRLLEARAEIDLAAARYGDAADAAVVAIDHADRYGRLKYGTLGRCVLSAALSAQSRHDDALTHARRAASDAQRLGHRPTLWRAMARLGSALEAVGEDAAAVDARARAGAAVDEVASGLSPERRRVFLASDPLAPRGPA